MPMHNHVEIIKAMMVTLGKPDHDQTPKCTEGCCAYMYV